jgi:hypothetical protein
MEPFELNRYLKEVVPDTELETTLNEGFSVDQLFKISRLYAEDTPRVRALTSYHQIQEELWDYLREEIQGEVFHPMY